MSGVEALTIEELRPEFENLLAAPLALAVSGGADSTALMHLVAEWVGSLAPAALVRMGPVPIIVLTVNHRLRPEADEEAIRVEAQARALGLPHETLAWHGASSASALQSAAREARYRLMNELLETEARQRGPAASKRRLVCAHHRDDQAETVLMRLARGSGLDGLSGMRRMEELDMTAIGGSGSLTVVRPLLEIPKSRLIATLKARGLQWSEDPSNVADRFERVRVRRALEVLESLGVNAGSIARSARRLARARGAIAADCAKTARPMIRSADGLVAEIDTAMLADTAEEYVIRILAALLAAYGGAARPARLSQIEQLAADLAALAHGSPSEAPKRIAVTLGGCRVEGSTGSSILIWRERGREPLPEFQLEPGARRLWDRRFLVSLAPRAEGPATVRALAGEWRQLPPEALHLAKRPVPRAALETTPSFWQADRLVAVPCVPGQEGDLQLYRAEFAGLRSLPYEN